MFIEVMVRSEVCFNTECFKGVSLFLLYHLLVLLDANSFLSYIKKVKGWAGGRGGEERIFILKT